MTRCCDEIFFRLAFPVLLEAIRTTPMRFDRAQHGEAAADQEANRTRSLFIDCKNHEASMRIIFWHLTCLFRQFRRW